MTDPLPPRRCQDCRGPLGKCNKLGQWCMKCYVRHRCKVCNGVAPFLVSGYCPACQSAIQDIVLATASCGRGNKLPADLAVVRIPVLTRRAEQGLPLFEPHPAIEEEAA